MNSCGGWSRKLQGRLDPDRVVEGYIKNTGQEKDIVGEGTVVTVSGAYHIMARIPSNSESRPALHRPAVWIWIQACSPLPV